jgi:predicted nucleotidyltransferase
MNDAKAEKLDVSEATLARLAELETRLKAILGDDLVALVVHGSAVRGGWRESSDVDLIVVVRDPSREQLEKLAEPLTLARYASRIEAMILTADEIPRAADVFPVFYDDIRRRHVVLFGKDPFADLTIAPQHLRLRVEQELREAQIRLRRVVVDSAGRPADLLAGARRKLKQIRSPLRELLALKKIDTADDLAAVVGVAAKTYGVDAATLLAADPADGFHAALASLLDAAVDDVDRMDAGDTP